jgi:hypothetical protein
LGPSIVLTELAVSKFWRNCFDLSILIPAKATFPW